MKSRIIISGLCKTTCISEYAPSISLLFSEDEVPTFVSYKECLDLVNQLLGDETQLAYHAEKLHSKILNEYEDCAQQKKLLPKIQKKEPLLVKFKPLPYWYEKRVAQARVRRLCAIPFRHICELLNILWSKPRLTWTLHKEVCKFYFSSLYRHFLHRPSSLSKKTK